MVLLSGRRLAAAAWRPAARAVVEACSAAARRSSPGHGMAGQNEALLVQRQAGAEQRETVRRPEGSAYAFPGNPDGKSLRQERSQGSPAPCSRALLPASGVK